MSVNSKSAMPSFVEISNLKYCFAFNPDQNPRIVTQVRYSSSLDILNPMVSKMDKDGILLTDSDKIKRFTSFSNKAFNSKKLQFFDHSNELELSALITKCGDKLAAIILRYLMLSNPSCLYSFFIQTLNQAKIFGEISNHFRKSTEVPEDSDPFKTKNSANDIKLSKFLEMAHILCPLDPKMFPNSKPSTDSKLFLKLLEMSDIHTPSCHPEFPNETKKFQKNMEHFLMSPETSTLPDTLKISIVIKRLLKDLEFLLKLKNNQEVLKILQKNLEHYSESPETLDTFDLNMWYLIKRIAMVLEYLLKLDDNQESSNMFQKNLGDYCKSPEISSISDPNDPKMLQLIKKIVEDFESLLNLKNNKGFLKMLQKNLEHYSESPKMSPISDTFDSKISKLIKIITKTLEFLLKLKNNQDSSKMFQKIDKHNPKFSKKLPILNKFDPKMTQVTKILAKDLHSLLTLNDNEESSKGSVKDLEHELIDIQKPPLFDTTNQTLKSNRNYSNKLCKICPWCKGPMSKDICMWSEKPENSSPIWSETLSVKNPLKTCFLCHETITMKKSFDERRFGILRKCECKICYGCIRKVTGTSVGMLTKTVRCPSCNVVSDTVAASTCWIEGKEKAEFFNAYCKSMCLEFNDMKPMSGCTDFRIGKNIFINQQRMVPVI